MTDDRIPGVEMLTLAARLAALPTHGSASGQTMWTGTAHGHAGFAGEGALSASVSIVATGEVASLEITAPPGTLTISDGTVWAYLLSLPPEKLLVIYGWLLPTALVGLQDPKTFTYAVIVTLPFLALVIRAINQRR